MSQNPYEHQEAEGLRICPEVRANGPMIRRASWMVLIATVVLGVFFAVMSRPQVPDSVAMKMAFAASLLIPTMVLTRVFRVRIALGGCGRTFVQRFSV